MKDYAYRQVLVSTQWVEEHLNDSDIRVIESNEDILLYKKGHIPGAVQIDWQADLQDQVTRDYVSKEEFEQLVSKRASATTQKLYFTEMKAIGGHVMLSGRLNFTDMNIA